MKEEDPVTPSSDKRGRGSGSGRDINKVGSKISRAVAKSRRGESSNDIKNGSNHNSGRHTLQAQGRG